MNTTQTVGELIHAMQGRIVLRSTYAGVKAVKSPCDAWVYQELVFERRPAYIIEIGNWAGGSLLMYAHWLDALGSGRVIGVDVDHSRVPAQVRAHPRITLLTGDAAQMAERVAGIVVPGAEVLVIEDSSHEAAQTLAVLRAYSGLVQPGGYFVVEDTICWHGLAHGPQPGPFEAVEAFLAESGGQWARDASREAFGLTWNPGGYLRRVHGST